MGFWLGQAKVNMHLCTVIKMKPKKILVAISM